MSLGRKICPFSKDICRECPIYRGRHLGVCSGGKEEGREWGSRMVRGHEAERRSDDYEAWKELKAPSIPRSPKMLADIEDLIERREA